MARSICGTLMGITLLAVAPGCGEDAVFGTASGVGGATTQSATGTGATGAGAPAGNGGASQGGAGVGGAGGVDPAQDPGVAIFHPGDMECRVLNMAIPCSGVASDPQDGMLMGSDLVWTSSLEGQLGVGSPISWTPTTVGSHALVLSATDSDGNNGSAQITINVQPQCQ